MTKNNIDWQKEYQEALKIMCTKNADLDKLSNAVAYAYLKTDDQFKMAFHALLIQIEKRNFYNKTKILI